MMAAAGFSQIILLVTLVATSLFIAGFVPERWIEKDFALPVPGKLFVMLNPEVTQKSPKLGKVLENQTLIVNVSARVGLYKTCRDTTATVYGWHTKKTYCGHKDARDWQKVAFGLAVPGFIFAVVSLVMSLLVVVVRKWRYVIELRFLIVVANFVTAGFIAAALIIYVMNKKIQVSPPLPTRIDFDLGWAYFITVASDCLFAVLVLLNVLHIVCFSESVHYEGENHPIVIYGQSQK